MAMKINLAISAGFCFGVRRAINIALKTAKTNRPVFMLGDIVHNEEVVKQIQKAGIKKINHFSCGDGKALLIRAHGCSSNTLQKAKKLGYTIIDATCPMVKEIHAIAKRLENKGFKIIVIGDKSHDEVVIFKEIHQAWHLVECSHVNLGNAQPVKPSPGILGLSPGDDSDRITGADGIHDGITVFHVGCPDRIAVG